MTNAQLQSG